MIRIIRETERNCFEFQGSKFYYRRLPMSQSIRINKEHTKRGLTDYQASGIAMLEWCLLDWEHVLDENDQAIPFSKELVKFLPEELINEITPCLREASPNKVDELGN